MINVLIADDHAVVRHGLKQILEENDDMKVVAEAGNGKEVVSWLRANDCDVLLLDISMPDMNGIDVLKLVREERPMLPVLILSIYSEDQYAARLIKNGAVGYMTKDSAPAEVVDAVRCAADGKKYISATVAELLGAKSSVPCNQPAHENLSDREYQIFLLLASAQAVSEIAHTLSLSVNTVSTYRRRILEKMGLHNNAELMRYAIEKNLLK